MAGYIQKPNHPPQEQYNPNKRNQDGEHPDSMQVEETPPKESITDEEISKMVCDEDDEDFSLGRDEIRKNTKKQKQTDKSNTPSSQGPFGTFMKAAAKTFSFAKDYKPISNSQPAFNPYKEQPRISLPTATTPRAIPRIIFKTEPIQEEAVIQSRTTSTRTQIS